MKRRPGVCVCMQCGVSPCECIDVLRACVSLVNKVALSCTVGGSIGYFNKNRLDGELSGPTTTSGLLVTPADHHHSLRQPLMTAWIARRSDHPANKNQRSMGLPNYRQLSSTAVHQGSQPSHNPKPRVHGRRVLPHKNRPATVRVALRPKPVCGRVHTRRPTREVPLRERRVPDMAPTRCVGKRPP